MTRRLYAAFAAGDMPTADGLLADDITWHAPGNGVNAGTRRGKQELYATMASLVELTGGTLRAEVHDVLASDDHAVVLQRTRGERAGFDDLDDREVTVLHISEGKFTEVWEHPGDLYGMDVFFA